MRRLTVAAIAALFFVLLTQPSLATTTSYSESFTTTAKKYTSNTTADWDTTLGQVSLFPWDRSVVATFATAGDAWRVNVSGDHVYAADGGGGLQVIDISNPASPLVAGSAAVTIVHIC